MDRHSLQGTISKSGDHRSLFRMIGSQIYSIVISFFAVCLGSIGLGFLLIRIQNAEEYFCHYFGFGIVTSVLYISIICFGFLLSLIEFFWIRKYIINWKIWIFGGGVIFSLVFLGCSVLAGKLIAPSLIANRNVVIPGTVDQLILPISLLCGFLIGSLGGLLFSLFQSVQLRIGKRTWWVISAITGGICAMPVMLFVNIMKFYMNMID